MKIDVSQRLKELDGTVMKDPIKNKKEKEIVRLKKILVNSLLAPKQEDNGTEKFEKYELALKINKVKKYVELTVENLSLLKSLVGEFFTVIIVGQVFKMLEENVVPKED